MLQDQDLDDTRQGGEEDLGMPRKSRILTTTRRV